MTRPATALALALLAVVGLWIWLGLPQPVPPSPLAAGEKLYCVSYTPFREGQKPTDLSTRITPQQIEEDFTRLAAITDCVRSYSTHLGLDAVPEIAARHGLKVILGAWIGRKKDQNAIETDTVIRLANAYPETVRAVVVGNEVLLRGEMSDAVLIDYIRKVKAAVKAPVTYADGWGFWLKNRSLVPEVDFATIHVLSYWEDVAADKAAQNLEEIRREVTQELAGKELLVGEMGWPSAGRMRSGALPSRSNQVRVLSEQLKAAKDGGYHVNVIEAFDQPWKIDEGAAGSHWGLFDAYTRTPKFAFGEAISDRPLWLWQAIGGALMVLATIAGGAFGARAHEKVAKPSWATKPSWTTWLGIAVMAAAGGIGVPMAAEALPIESHGIASWCRNGLELAAAVAAAPVAAAVLAAGRALEGFGAILDPVERAVTDAWTKVPVLLFTIVTVLAAHGAMGLAFDPRYQNFRFAPLTATVVPWAVLALLGARPPRARGIAEISLAVAMASAAVFVAINETFANWQALWAAALWLVLALTLLRIRGAQS